MLRSWLKNTGGFGGVCLPCKAEDMKKHNNGFEKGTKLALSGSSFFTFPGCVPLGSSTCVDVLFLRIRSVFTTIAA